MVCEAMSVYADGSNFFDGIATSILVLFVLCASTFAFCVEPWRLDGVSGGVSVLTAPLATGAERLELLSMKKPPTRSNIAFAQGERPCDKLRLGWSFAGAQVTGLNLLLKVSLAWPSRGHILLSGPRRRGFQIMKHSLDRLFSVSRELPLRASLVV